MRFIFQSDRWRSKSIICRKAEITLRQQGKQERSARPRKCDGLPRAPLLGELSNEVRLRGLTRTLSSFARLKGPRKLFSKNPEKSERNLRFMYYRE